MTTELVQGIDSTLEDFINCHNALTMMSVSRIYSILDTNAFPSYDVVVAKMNECFNNISSDRLKGKISSLVDDVNETYLNNNGQNTFMAEKNFLDSLLLYTSEALNLSKSVNVLSQVMPQRLEIFADVSSACQSKEITETDRNIISKIYDCYAFSRHIQQSHSDYTISPMIQRECIKEYRLISTDKGREILSKYLPPEFLKKY